MNIQVYSFDIYDTCISRTFASPRDLFFSLGAKLAIKHSLPEKRDEFAQSVAKLRIRGEKKANFFRKSNEAVGLDEIYRHIVIPSNWGFSITEMMALELETEGNSVYSIRPIKERIQAIRRDGKRIVFISDMYLDADFLRSILAKFSLIEPTDSLYVSCQVGLSKRSGNLFQHVLKMEAIKPSELLHTGDDLIADVERPRRLGINVVPFDFDHLNRFEKSIYSSRSVRKTVASRACAISRKVRINIPANNKASSIGINNYISSSVAPFLTTYVGWVIFEAKKLNLDRLYFVARDGEILLKIAKILAERFPTPELRYLHGSRRAWLVPSISLTDNTWKRLVINQPFGSSKHEILSRVGMNPDEIDTTLRRQSVRMDSASQIMTPIESIDYLDSLIRNIDNSKIIFDHVQVERDLVIGYLHQEGLFDTKSWALVDVGWSLNSHAALRRILKLLHPEKLLNMNSFSIGFAKDRLPEHITGLSRAMLPDVGSFLSRRRAVIEHIFTPSLRPTTIGYCRENNNYNPRYGIETRNREQIAYAALVQKIVCDYASEAIACDEIWEHFDYYKCAAINMAKKFIFTPTAEEAVALKGYFVNADIMQDQSHIRKLCRPLIFHDLLSFARSVYKPTASDLRELPLWLECSAALSPNILRTIVCFLLRLQRVISCRFF